MAAGSGKLSELEKISKVDVNTKFEMVAQGSDGQGLDNFWGDGFQIETFVNREGGQQKAAIQTAVDGEKQRAVDVEGALASLGTNNKSNLVAAVNEVKRDGTDNAQAVTHETARAQGVEGSLADLNTTDKTNLAAAINTVKTESDANAQQITVLQTNLGSEASARAAADLSLGKRIDAQEGLGGYVTAYDFGSDTPEQKDITAYVKEKIWGADADSHEEGDIFNGTRVVNLYDNYTWVLVNTPNTQPAVFVWELAGVFNISTASNDLAGIILGDAAAPGAVSVTDSEGRAKANGVAEHFADTDVHITVGERERWDNAVQTTSRPDKVYGTDENGNPLMYGKNDFGAVDTVDGIAPDTGKNVKLTWLFENEADWNAQDKSLIPLNATVIKQWINPSIIADFNYPAPGVEQPVLNPDGGQKKWVDGKLLYRRCIQFTRANAVSAAWETLANIPGLKDVIRHNLLMKYTDSGQDTWSSNYGTRFNLRPMGNGNLTAWFFSILDGSPISTALMIIVEYTKA